MVQEVEMTSLRFDESLVNGHFNDILNSFCIYVEDIQPLIINIEELKSEFPSEILNEIRAMYTHLCRAYMAGTDDDVVSNIEKLKTHTKRALLDCYKNSCIVIIDQRKFFFQKYKGVDLSLISEGDFLRKELNAYRQTIDTLKAAKKAEGVNTNTDKLFALYQEAYQNALVLDEILCEAENSATYLKRKAMRREIASYVFGVIGVVGTVITIIGFLK